MAPSHHSPCAGEWHVVSPRRATRRPKALAVQPAALGKSESLDDASPTIQIAADVGATLDEPFGCDAASSGRDGTPLPWEDSGYLTMVSNVLASSGSYRGAADAVVRASLAPTEVRERDGPLACLLSWVQAAGLPFGK